MSGRLTLRHLELFAAVYEHGGVTAAAQHLQVAQPSVSQAVRDLEDHFHTVLFERMPRRMVPTDAGRRLFIHARELLDGFDSLEHDMVAGGIETLRIAASITTGTRYLPRFLTALSETSRAPRSSRQEMPGDTETAPVEEIKIKAQVVIEDSASVEKAVVSGEADVGLVEGIVRSSDIVAEVFAHDKLVVIAPADVTCLSEVDEKHSLAPEELVRLPLVLREQGSGVRDLFEAALRAQGLPCNPVWESVSTQALIAAVEAGLGLSAVPLALAQDALARKSVRCVSVPGLSLERELLVIRHRRKLLTPGLKAFLSCVLERPC